jgi:UDP-2-acetamido-2,6-beta-L-arabino-hexul-4-ose reductase
MSFERATIAVTGAAGFVGSNLVVRLGEMDHAAAAIARSTPAEEAEAVIGRADIVFHLAGANRTQDEADYQRSNRDYTRWVAEAVAKGGRKPLIVHSGSTKALDDTDYGRSKRAAEEVLLELAAGGHATTSIWRLPNVFGKWARPNYNSAVATFCHNAARGEPLRNDELFDFRMMIMAAPSNPRMHGEKRQLAAVGGPEQLDEHAARVGLRIER